MVSVKQLKSEVGTKNKSLTRAFNTLIDLLPPKIQKSSIDEATFSDCISFMENKLLKQFCLYNYYDGRHTENIQDFVVSFDHLKKKKAEIVIAAKEKK